MVAGHHEYGSRESVKEGAGGYELPCARALRQIARDHDQVHIRVVHLIDERVNDGRAIDAPEVDVREVGEAVDCGLRHGVNTRTRRLRSADGA